MKKGRPRWPYLRFVQNFYKKRMNDQGLPDYVRDWYEEMYNLLLIHEWNVEDSIKEVLEGKIPNSAFPDDRVGWLDDGFEEDEDEEEED